MARSIWTWGLLAGLIIYAGFLWQINLGSGDHGAAAVVLGYLIMLAGLSLVFVGIKRFRDRELGGVIRFWPALKLGLGIAGVASLCYVLGWEAWLAATDYRFMDDYANGLIAAKQTAGASAADMAKLQAEIADMKRIYANPLTRMLMTLAEIAPVALLVPLVSAALLRNPRLLPARGKA